MPNHVEIYTDGGCEPNPGPGKWAAVILEAEKDPIELTGTSTRTTNNRMEMQGVISALQYFEFPVYATIYSDSEYVVRGASKWMLNWQKNAWRRKFKKEWLPVKNDDLWRKIFDLSKIHTLNFQWVKGHNGNYWNEHCDNLTQPEVLSEPVIRTIPSADVSGGNSGVTARTRHNNSWRGKQNNIIRKRLKKGYALK